MRSLRRIPSPEDNQFKLFEGVAAESKPRELKTAVESGRCFVRGDAKRIYIGATPLQAYLEESGQQAPFTVSRLLSEQNWEVFERRYGAVGRAPYAPELMMGLILYGLLRGVHSLRELEQLARLDLGCMWVTGGITPDHANIGRFIVMHEDSLSSDFFESLTRSILKERGTSHARLAGDGTVIEAACSNYKLLKEEAVKQRVAEARKALEHKPDDPQAQQAYKSSQRCEEIFEERKASIESRHKNSDSLRISASEPEAMVQHLKRRRGVGPSYKPSVLVNEDRIITAFAVDASNETKVLSGMLDQSKQVTGTEASELLLDAGYFHDEVIQATLDRDISLLCPPGRTTGKKQGSLFHKSEFEYDPVTDTYRCPAGKKLILLHQCRATEKTRQHRLYGTNACSNCALRDQCTKGKEGRRIKCYPEDEYRNALRQVMEQPQAKRIFSQRQAMVEPVFSAMRGQQGFNRFRRKGLRAVKREFALHVLAYNLSRAIALIWLLFILIRTTWRAPRATSRLFLKTFFKLDRSVAPEAGRRLIAV